jgi:plastocyanin
MVRSTAVLFRAPGLRTLGSLLAAGALAVGQLSLAAIPVAAAAPSLVVTADQPAAVPAGHNWAFNDFFPRSLTVTQGTTIGFMIEGFHTATLLPAGVTAAQDNATAGIAQADPDDTSPNPNGTTHSAFSMAALSPAPATGCGTDASPCTFDGTSAVSSGAPLAAPPTAPFDVTITAAPGTYVFHCRIHPQMNATLTVVAPGGTATTPAELTAAVQSQIASDVAAGTTAENAANAAGKSQNPDGSTHWTLTAGTQSPDGYTVVLEMLPENVDIKSGDTVTWHSIGINEPHTVTFPKDLFTDQVPLCESGTVDVPAVPTVNPPTGPQDFACGSGPADEIEIAPGNGVSTVTSPTTVSDSGLLTAPGGAEAFGLPASASLTSWTVKFTGAVAGTYTYICQIHGPAMHGTLTIAAATPTPTPTPTVTLPPTSTAPLAPASGAAGVSGAIWLLVASLGLLVGGLAIGRRARR